MENPLRSIGKRPLVSIGYAFRMRIERAAAAREERRAFEAWLRTQPAEYQDLWLSCQQSAAAG
jgi:hypothetical protein